MSKPVSAIVLAGLACGVMDISAAFVTWGVRGVKPTQVLQGVASGWFGPASFQGGMKTVILGAVFHFLIAFTAAAVYYTASRYIPFMTRQAIISGVIYGVAVYAFMYYLVLPLSNARRGSPTIAATIIAIVTHMVCVGLPIALIVRRYSK